LYIKLARLSLILKGFSKYIKLNLRSLKIFKIYFKKRELGFFKRLREYYNSKNLECELPEDLNTKEAPFYTVGC
jgi:hypothetical protein